MNTRGELPRRRARRPNSLSTAVADLLEDIQCPVPTSAVRVILTARGRPVTAEQLSRLAAYQRQDFERTRVAPLLCWAVDPQGAAVFPRWWALGDWRLLRRIKTEDVVPIWFATLATRLCSEIAKQPSRSTPEFATLARGASSLALGEGQTFDLPMSSEEWLELRQRVYAPYGGALNNQTGGTQEQYEIEKSLTSNGLSGFELLFGRQ